MFKGRRTTTPFFEALEKQIQNLGGMFNAHLHIDRIDTCDATLDLLSTGLDSAASLSLQNKHALIPKLHASHCYSTGNLHERVTHYLHKMADLGTTRADTVVDVTDDQVQYSAIETLLSIRHQLQGTIDFRVGAYTPLGFRDDEPARWNLVETAAEFADFIGSLPERDDIRNYPDHIGFEESCRRILDLGGCLNKPVHIHVDQQNIVEESETETLIEIVRNSNWKIPEGEPWIWVVHVISPSNYEEERFQRLVKGLVELNIGVICCPSAAISMRQLHHLKTPTYNSIARVLDFLAAGIQVRIGSDNICDITSPAGTIDLLDEIFVLCNAMRYYDITIWAYVAAGQPLDSACIERLQAHLLREKAALS